MKHDTRIVSHPVDAPAADVYDFACRMENLPRWAAGLVTSIRQEGDAWFADTPGGRITIVMAPRNELGVLDHDVTTADRVTTHNAMRVTPIGGGSLLAFVVLRMAQATEAAFAGDCALVLEDLKTLAALVEKGARG